MASKNRVFRLTDDEYDAMVSVAARLSEETGQRHGLVDVLRRGVKALAGGPGLLPNYGRVPCGRARPVLDDSPDRLDVRALFTGPDLYVLTADGSSMTGRQIADGDYLICRKADTADHGEIVVAWLDGEVTLKVYQTRTKGRTVERWLHPAADGHAPVRLDPKSDNRILGVLVGVIRKVK
jgi:repressor LexA